ncbi:MAG TPA: hypothetical protein VIJ66_09415 [Solirubrobacteraceae bacterium]
MRRDVQDRELDVEPFDDGRPVTVGRLLIDDLPERPGAALPLSHLWAPPSRS